MLLFYVIYIGILYVTITYITLACGEISMNSTQLL